MRGSKAWHSLSIYASIYRCGSLYLARPPRQPHACPPGRPAYFFVHLVAKKNVKTGLRLAVYDSIRARAEAAVYAALAAALALLVARARLDLAVPAAPEGSTGGSTRKRVRRSSLIVLELIRLAPLPKQPLLKSTHPCRASARLAPLHSQSLLRRSSLLVIASSKGGLELIQLASLRSQPLLKSTQLCGTRVQLAPLRSQPLLKSTQLCGAPAVDHIQGYGQRLDRKRDHDAQCKAPPRVHRPRPW